MSATWAWPLHWLMASVLATTVSPLCPPASKQHGHHCVCNHGTGCVGCDVGAIADLHIYGFDLRTCPNCRCAALQQLQTAAAASTRARSMANAAQGAGPVTGRADVHTAASTHVCLGREQYHAGAGSWQKRASVNGSKGSVPPEEDSPCCSWDTERGQPTDWVHFCTSRPVFYTVGHASQNHRDYRLVVDSAVVTPENFDAVLPVAQFGSHGCTSGQSSDPRSASQVFAAAARVGAWEWVPSTCRLPSFDAVEFCDRLAG